MFKVNDILTADCDVSVWHDDGVSNLIFRNKERALVDNRKNKPIFLLLRLEPNKQSPSGFKHYFLFDGEICVRYDVAFFILLSRIEE